MSTTIMTYPQKVCIYLVVFNLQLLHDNPHTGKELMIQVESKTNEIQVLEDKNFRLRRAKWFVKQIIIRFKSHNAQMQTVNGMEWYRMLCCQYSQILFANSMGLSEEITKKNEKEIGFFAIRHK